MSIWELSVRSVAAVGTILTTIIIWWKMPFKWGGGRWYAHYKSNRDTWRTLLTYNQKEMTQKIDLVVSQLHPNGGTSLFDKVDKILDSQAILKEIIDAAFYLDSTPTFKCDMMVIANL